MLKKLLLLISLFTSVVINAQYTDSISVSLTDATNFETTTGWYNKPNTTATTTLKDGKSITLAAACDYDPWTDGSSCYLPTTAFESYHIRWNTTPLTYTLTGFSQDTLITIKIMSSVEYSTATTTTASATGSSVFNGNSIDAANNSCDFIVIEDIECNSSGNIVITVSHSTGDFTAANTIQIFYQGSSLSTFCQTSDLDATASIISDTALSSKGAINITTINGVSPYTYLWSSLEETEDISNKLAGTYSLTITDDSGCVFQDSYVISNYITGSGGNHRVTDSILINVEGFLPNATKYAVFRDTTLTGWYIVDSITNNIVDGNDLTYGGAWKGSDDAALFTPGINIADFSSFTTSGVYYLIGYNSTDTVRGYNFNIDSSVYRNAVKLLWRSFYQNRNSSTVAKGGIWGRDAGYPMDEVILHNSAANGVTRFTGDTIIAWKNGWHDAGDYNVYPTNYGQPLFNMLFAYEMYPGYFNSLTWDLPETGNGLPDILNTAIDGLRFLIYAQDPYDGGIYSVETSTEFEPYWTYSDLLPENYTFTPHYWTRKSTNATRVGGAVLYMGARIFESLGYTDFADSCLAAAEKANNWQRANPIVQYDMASLTSPAIETGDYQCDNLPNAYHWINAECYITTGRQGAYDSLITSLDFGGFYNTPSYGSNHEIYAIMSMEINNAWQSTDSATYMPGLFNIIDDQITYFKSTNATWKTSMGTENQGDFPWGSNSYLGTRITMQLLAYNMTGDSDYLNMATNDIDYIMGRNAVGRCFITGFGEGNHQITEIHHRQSICDGITAPVPGLLSGGPANVEYDQGGGTPVVDYTGLEVAEHWVHNHNSFCSNETAINWVAPVATALSMLDAIYYSEEESNPSYPVSYKPYRTIHIRTNNSFYIKDNKLKLRP